MTGFYMAAKENPAFYMAAKENPARFAAAGSLLYPADARSPRPPALRLRPAQRRALLGGPQRRWRQA